MKNIYRQIAGIPLGKPRELPSIQDIEQHQIVGKNAGFIRKPAQDLKTRLMRSFQSQVPADLAGYNTRSDNGLSPVRRPGQIRGIGVRENLFLNPKNGQGSLGAIHHRPDSGSGRYDTDNIPGRF